MELSKSVWRSAGSARLFLEYGCRLMKRSGINAALLITPAFLLFSVFVVIPVVQAAYYSLYEWNGIGPLQAFRGFGNFIQIIQHTIFHTALLNNIKIVIASLLLQLPLAFIIALLIGRKRYRGEMFFRGVFFFPYIIAEIVVGIIWRFIYYPEFGIPTLVMQFITGQKNQIGLLGDPNVAFYAVLVVILWKYMGFHLMLFIAGLQGVPAELEDAAVVDGANSLQTIWHIIIPSMKTTFIISIFQSVIGSFNVFDVVWAMGQGGPVNSTETIVTYLYNFGFRRFNFGYGSAVAVILFFICLVFNVLYQRYVVGDESNDIRS